MLLRGLRSLVRLDQPTRRRSQPTACRCHSSATEAATLGGAGARIPQPRQRAERRRKCRRWVAWVAGGRWWQVDGGYGGGWWWIDGGVRIFFFEHPPQKMGGSWEENGLVVVFFLHDEFSWKEIGVYEKKSTKPWSWETGQSLFFKGRCFLLRRTIFWEYPEEHVPKEWKIWISSFFSCHKSGWFGAWGVERSKWSTIELGDFWKDVSRSNIFSSPISKARSNFRGFLISPYFFQFSSSSIFFPNLLQIWQIWRFQSGNCFFCFLPAKKHDLLRKWTCNSLQILLALRR